IAKLTTCLHEVPPFVEREHFERLKRMVACVVRSGPISPAGEPGYGEGRRADQSGFRRILQTANVELRHVVLAGQIVFRDGAYLVPSLIAEPEFVDHGRAQNLCVAACNVDLPLVVDGAESRKGVWGIGI